MRDGGNRLKKIADRMSRLISFFSIEREIGVDYQVFLNEITAINWFRLKIFGLLSIIIFSVLLFADRLYFVSGRWNLSPGYPILFFPHLSLWIILVTALSLAWLKPLRDRKYPSRFHRNLILSTLFLGMLHLVVISIGDVLINGSVAAYIGMVFSFAAIFVFSGWFCFAFFLSGTVFMLILLAVASEIIRGDLSIQIINVITFSIIAVVLSRMTFYSHARDFLNRKLINEQKRKLEILSRQDHLTNALNRRSFSEISSIETDRIKRFGGCLSLAIFDLDHFKQVNDRYGHAAGDAVLIKMTNAVMERLRKTDTLFRWGGEEFVVLSRETTLSGMIILAEELRRSISDCAVKNVHGITASFGVTEYLTGESIEDALQRADNALYAAKQNGRNRVEFKPHRLTSPSPSV